MADCGLAFAAGGGGSGGVDAVWRAWANGSAEAGDDRTLSVTSPLNVPGGAPEPEEAYAIYSALYQEKSNEALAFANYTSTDIPQLDGSCLKPQTPDERAMAEAFEAANKQSHPWEQKFAIAQGYRLLTARETNEAMECLEAGEKAASAARVRGVQGPAPREVPGRAGVQRRPHAGAGIHHPQMRAVLRRGRDL